MAVAWPDGPGIRASRQAAGEDLPYGGARLPGQVQRVERGALGLGDRRGHGESGADAAAPGRLEQLRAGLDDLAQHVRRVGGDGAAAGRGGDELAAEPDERGAEAVGVHLGGEHDGAFRVDGEPVRGAALRSDGGAGAGVDGDQPERFQLGGDGAGGRPGHAEFGGEHGAGGRAAGVDEFQCGAEGAAASLQLACTRRGHTSILALCRH